MKVKEMIVSMLAIAALTSCTESLVEEPVTNETKKANLSLTVKVEKPSKTYAVDNPSNISEESGLTSNINDAFVFLLNGSSVIKTYEFFGDSAASISTNGLHIENVPQIANAVMFIANVKGYNEDLKSLKTLSSIERFSFDIEKEQSSVENPVVSNATMMGYSTINVEVGEYNAAYEPVYYNLTANVQLSPIVSRIEFYGISVGSGLSSIVVDSVYLSNYYKTNDFSYIVKNGNSDECWFSPEPIYPSAMCDALGSATTTENTCIAYQFFPSSSDNASLLPNIVLKVHGAYSDYNTFANKFITVTSFKQSNNTTLTCMKAASVYKIPVFSVSVTNLTSAPYEPENTMSGVAINVDSWSEEVLEPAM